METKEDKVRFYIVNKDSKGVNLSLIKLLKDHVDDAIYLSNNDSENYLVYDKINKILFWCNRLPSDLDSSIWVHCFDGTKFLDMVTSYHSKSKENESVDRHTKQSGKFIVSHVDGSPVDKDADYVVFRIDKNSKWSELSRAMIKYYIMDIANIDKEFALYLFAKII